MYNYIYYKSDPFCPFLGEREETERYNIIFGESPSSCYDDNAFGLLLKGYVFDILSLRYPRNNRSTFGSGTSYLEAEQLYKYIRFYHCVYDIGSGSFCIIDNINCSREVIINKGYNNFDFYVRVTFKTDKKWKINIKYKNNL